MISASSSTSPGRKRFAGIVVILFSLLMISFFSFQEYRNWQFDQPVTRTSGKIIGLFWSGGRHPSPTIAYDYPTPSGVVHQSGQAIGNDTWNRLRVGEMVPVKFLPSQPSVSRIDLPSEDQNQHSPKRFIAWLMIAVFMGLGIFNLKSAKR